MKKYAVLLFGALIIALCFKLQKTGAAVDLGHFPLIKKTRNKFIDDNYLHALETERSFGVPVITSLSQGAMESGWGKSKLYNLNNVHCIKCKKHKAGVEGCCITINNSDGISAFKVYGSRKESWDAYVKTLSKSRYNGAVNDNHIESAKFIAKGGWATEHDYIERWMPIMGKVKNILDE